MNVHTQPVRAKWAAADPLLTAYYDNEWGLPVHDEAGIFERLSLEAFQAGLSWLTILRKREALRMAFSDFDPEVVARFGEQEIARLLEDEGIVRNRSKILATIGNARAVLRLRGEGGIAALVWSYMPEQSPVPETDANVPSASMESEALAARLKREGFKFVGPTTVYALMTAIGMVDVHLRESHRRGCSGLWNLDGSRRTDVPG